MNIKRLVQIAAAALLGTMLVCAVVFTMGINSIRIGGSHERQIERASALEADLLPPPLFVVEPYAVAMEGLNHPERAAETISRLEAMHKQYEDRKSYWKTADVSDTIRATIEGSSMKAGDAFWAVINDRTIPALRRNDPASTGPVLNAMSAAYHNQKGQLDESLQSVAKFKTETLDSSKSALTWTASLLIGLGLLLFAGLIFCAVLLMRRVIDPLGRVADVTTELADGRNVPVPFTDRHDELGAMARAVDHFRESANIRAERDAKDSAEKKGVADALGEMLAVMADGDLRKQLNVVFPGSYKEIGESLNKAIGALRSMVQQVVLNATSIRSAAGEISAASQDLSERTQSNAAAIEETTAALANVDSRIASTRDAAESTAQSASRAKSAVDQGRSKAQFAAATMEEVRESAASVDGVMEALDKIAFQTRVLAMNAAVEAGHAGEAGKGFAVVADLVSQLAARAEEEARKAREQLTATSAKIGQAVTSVGEVEQEFAGIVDDVASVTELVERLTEDARAQASAVTEISAAMRQMDVSTQQNAAMVEQTSAAAGSLLADAQKLVDQAETFKWDRRMRQKAVPFERRGRTAQEVASINAVHAEQASLEQRLSDAA
ncbi:methyl-accepting chemotaxis protein [Sphingomonas ginkgonis]|uniref:Methyl-accepting chemotaxis protein n=1 Tax=Sphingomonas ginkgonis TaxID=2315330 RepID=A0A429VCR3_9SPHN|nr:HAMP domain-containing methyl-accepting chemotaxis protein [Sphingomonas ginkgonis]RST31795.1 methyl-accepting chemotaxis protein [Sphingomonas ginkgonis]